MEGVTGIAGRDEMEHDRNFLAFMEKCMSNNLTLNAKKIQFKQTQVSFYGHCWSKQGISLDPKKIEALNHMELPLDEETIRSFLGMVNYINQYSALSAHLPTPLSALTHQAVDYKPSKVHFENLNRLKMEVSNMGALPYFDVNAETPSRWMLPRGDLVHAIYRRGKWFVMLPELLPRLNRIIRIWRETSTRNHLGNGKVPLFLVWKGTYIGNQPEASCEYLQETYD